MSVDVFIVVEDDIVEELFRVFVSLGRPLHGFVYPKLFLCSIFFPLFSGFGLIFSWVYIFHDLEDEIPSFGKTRKCIFILLDVTLDLMNTVLNLLKFLFSLCFPLELVLFLFFPRLFVMRVLLKKDKQIFLIFFELFSASLK
jgi:hypothetical protein